jgi:DNA-binding NtrC family response regulator
MARLLIVDDEEQLLELYRKLFRRQKFEVLTATSVSDALIICRTNPPDVIVADACMRDGGVLALLGAIGNRLAVLVNTGSDAVSIAAAARHLGAVDVVEKGNGPIALLNTVKRVLSAKE